MWVSRLHIIVIDDELRRAPMSPKIRQLGTGVHPTLERRQVMHVRGHYHMG